MHGQLQRRCGFHHLLIKRRDGRAQHDYKAQGGAHHPSSGTERQVQGANVLVVWWNVTGL